MIKVILFDIDDTLIKTYETKKEALKEFGRNYYKVELEDEMIKAHWGKPMRALLLGLFNHYLEDAFEQYTIVREKHPTPAYEYAIATLMELFKNYLLGIITSKSIRYTKSDLKAAGIPYDIFFIIQTDEESEAHKPDPKVFNYVLKSLKKKNIHPSEVLYVGDSLLDFYAARDAGLQFYGIADRIISKS